MTKVPILSGNNGGKDLKDFDHRETDEGTIYAEAETEDDESCVVEMTKDGEIIQGSGDEACQEQVEKAIEKRL